MPAAKWRALFRHAERKMLARHRRKITDHVNTLAGRILPEKAHRTMACILMLQPAKARWLIV